MIKFNNKKIEIDLGFGFPIYDNHLVNFYEKYEKLLKINNKNL